jgi:glucose/arabinose dehydrogenase
MMTTSQRLVRSAVLLVTAALMATPASAQLRAVVYVSGLSLPVGWAQHPSNPYLQYVVQQGGLVRIIDHGVLQPTPFLDLSGVVTPPPRGERGLLGIAFPADHAATGRFYVNFTDVAGNTVIARFKRSTTSPAVADPLSRFDLRWPSGQRFIAQPYTNHNGGHLAFGPDGYLYIGLGDGGGAHDPDRNAQDPNELLGKMLRIDVSVADADVNGYRVPGDNPFVDNLPIPALDEIWAFGYRNPWRYSFDDPARGGTGALVVGDVGQQLWEEINYEPAGRGGRNYGWPGREGAHPNPTAPVPPAYTPVTDPIHEYSHPTGVSVTGGFVYRGHALPARFRGRYFYADFLGRVWSVGLNVSGTTGEATAFGLEEHTAELGGQTTLGFVTSWGTDAAGELYIINYGAGAVLKVVGLSSPGDLVSDFGAAGLWTASIPGGWSPLHHVSPKSFASGDLDGNGIDEVVVDFGDAHGIWIRMNNTSWTPLHVLSGNHLTVADLDRSGQDEVIVDFPGFGIWIWANNAAWSQLHVLNSNRIAAGNLDGTGGEDLVVDFKFGLGLWMYSNNSAWSQLHMLNGASLVTGDFDGNGQDDLVVDFPGLGLYLRANNAAWFLLHQVSPRRMAVGNVDLVPKHDLVVDFGASFGVWMWVNGVSWVPIHAVPTEALVVNDFDRNGQDDITIAFDNGFGLGLWTYFNLSAWGQLHPQSPRAMAPARLW